ncbi:MAG: FAD-binding oxidoreductase [Chloroflexota bacterium]|nr:FAD-binding oxidoreductase [Chloroflexota bacterium]MDE2884200.1 FAD-binding oxidoreductase [Chloroflexota bacterium]
MSAVPATDLHDALAAIVGVQHVSTDDESRERLSFDAVTAHRLGGRSELAGARVEAVARPATTEEVAAVVVFASERGIPVVPYGGGTGVMGAVVPVRGGIALDLRRMDDILEVSREDRMARVQPGVYLADLDAVARDHGMMLGHDPWSVPIATVGGAISTDSVGYRASRYGSMGQQVRALEVVLGSGEVVRTRPIQRQSSGPMLKGLFAGAEGTMGVITEATIDLRSLPEAREFASVGFDTFEQGYPVVARLFDIGLVPALIDLTEEPATPENAAPCILYLGFEGYREQVEAQRTRAMAEALAAGGRDLGPGPTREYWETRHAVAERWRDHTRPLRPTERWKEQRWRYADYLHVAMPVSRVLAYKRSCEEIAARHGLDIRESAVWTHPELFSVFVRVPAPPPLPTGEDRGEGAAAALRQAVDAMLEEALRLGGGVEYCHGLGVKLGGWAEREWGDALLLARRLKRAVDPDGILNPGKLGL